MSNNNKISQIVDLLKALSYLIAACLGVYLIVFLGWRIGEISIGGFSIGPPEDSSGIILEPDDVTPVYVPVVMLVQLTGIE